MLSDVLLAIGTRVGFVDALDEMSGAGDGDNVPNNNGVADGDDDGLDVSVALGTVVGINDGVADGDDDDDGLDVVVGINMMVWLTVMMMMDSTSALHWVQSSASMMVWLTVMMMMDLTSALNDVGLIVGNDKIDDDG